MCYSAAAGAKKGQWWRIEISDGYGKIIWLGCGEWSPGVRVDAGVGGPYFRSGPTLRYPAKREYGAKNECGEACQIAGRNVCAGGRG